MVAGAPSSSALLRSFVKFDIFGCFWGLAAQRGRAKGFFFIEKPTLMSGTEGASGGASEGLQRWAKVDWLGPGFGGTSPAELGANSGIHGTLHGSPGLAGLAGTLGESCSWSS